MGFIAKQSQREFKLVPPGTYTARCYQMIDLGTQRTSGQFGEKLQHKIRISWEIFGEDDEGKALTVDVQGKQMPMTVDREFTLSMHENSTLRAFLGTWRGKAFTDDEAFTFDVSRLVGAYAMVSVAHSESKNGKTYANVTAAAKLPKALSDAKPAGVHQEIVFNLDDPDLQVFENLPQWIQDKIQQSPEWERKWNRSAKTDDLDHDIPF
jgi:hypothetical protein